MRPLSAAERDSTEHPPRPDGFSAWANLPRMLYAPADAFSEIGRRPAWLVAALAAILVRLAHLFMFYRPSLEPPKLVLSLILESVPYLLPVLLCSVVFFLGLLLMGEDPSFKKVFSVMAHTFFVYNLLTVGLGSIVLLLAPDRERDGSDLLVANLGFLVDREKHLALEYLVSSVDLISVYHLALIALGLSIIARRVPLRRARWLVAALWVAYVAIRVAIKAAVA